MRRAQSVRHYPRPSLAQGGVDDLGILRENEDSESAEDVLRKQLMDKERECDKLQLAIQALQDQLAQRPPIEKILEIQKEHKNLELLFQGTLRENEKCMSDLERARIREKTLERELARIAGENWQENLEIAPLPSLRPGMIHQRSNTISSPLTLNIGRHGYSPSPSPRPDSRIMNQSPDHPPQQSLNLAQIEQIRMLILGMEQRLQVREEKLVKTMERAEDEGRRFESLRSEIVGTGDT